MRKLAALVTILALAAVACSGTGDPPPNLSFGRDPGDGRPVELALAGAGLERFDACGDLLDYVHEQTLSAVGPYGLQGVGGPMMDLATAGAGERSMALEDSDGGADAQAAAPAAGGGAPGSFSGTNVQVEGVDEPDLVKTDGQRMIVVGQGRVHVFDVSDGTPRKLSELDLRQDGWDHQLLLDGDRLLIVTRGHKQIEPAATDGGPTSDDAGRMAIDMMPMAETTIITVYDLADAAAPSRVSRLELDGGYVSARLVGGVARVVTRSQPMALPFAYPMEGTPEEEARVTEHNREVIESSTVEDWLPSYVLETDRSSSSGQLVSCDQVHHPVEFAGPSTLSVVTVDPDDPRPGNTVSILAGAETVYASPDALYVATTDWEAIRIMNEGGAPPQDVDLSTAIHKFDISDPSTTRYIGSGAVQGTLLNQFAMDEHEGNLRVATTTAPAWFGDDGGSVSESFVTVLTERGEGLEEVGKVGGLGRDERIYSVRFMGDLGYVVTFRQVDPLYVIDLSDPAAPTVRGELKILGYSAYLHPMGDGLLLGVGQDATEEGRTQGTQLAIFDVSNPADPRRIHQLRIDGASSSAEYDHHAFLYWAATGLTVLPVQTYGAAVLEDDVDRPAGPDSWWAGAIAFDVDAAGGIVEQGRITHVQRPDDHMAAIERSVVVGDVLYTLSQKGLMASDLGTLTEQAFVEFPVFEQ